MNVMTVMRSQYKGKPRAVFLMNAPRTFSIIWAVLSRILDATALARVSINRGSQSDALRALVSDDQLEDRYGGNVPQKTENFWPPSYPSDNFSPV